MEGLSKLTLQTERYPVHGGGCAAHKLLVRIRAFKVVTMHFVLGVETLSKSELKLSPKFKVIWPRLPQVIAGLRHTLLVSNTKHRVEDWLVYQSAP